jgi:AAA+ ATPase superfamily predicted ATPase
MKGFIGRKGELGLLNQWYSGDRFEFVAMYGRRRIGKTEIIKQFAEGKPTIFFTAMRTKGNLNMRLFNETVRRFSGTETGMLYFDELFKIIADNAAERLVLIIDEFPYFAESDNDILSALQIFIDHTALRTKLFLILCGSSMSFMKRQVLGYESPLYGRRTHEMHIRPMNYMEASEFLPERNNYEKACVYGAVGGIPMYLNKFSGKDSIFKIMADEFFSDGSILSSEPESLILQELQDPKKYNGIIEAVAAGSTRLSEISGRSGIASPETSKNLDDLIDLGYVERIVPVNEKSERKSRYYISDNLFRFYYQQVIGQKQTLSGRSLKETSNNLELKFPEYMGRVFESMCTQYVKERMGYPLTGKWWGSPSKDVTAEIDIIGSVGRAGRAEGLFAECKFAKRQADVDDLERLKKNAMYVKGFDARYYALFSRSGFTDRLAEKAEAEGVALITLDMMYDAV